MTNSNAIQVGGLNVPLAEATEWVDSYFNFANRTAARPYAFPAYDMYDCGSEADRLNDGDLLASTLLNAKPSVRAFYALQGHRSSLEAILRSIDAGARLADSRSPNDLAPLAAMGDVLDALEERVGVRMTILSKVMHRKRPAFIPLYDSFVYQTYVGSSPTHPIKPDEGRSWSQFMVEFGGAVSLDLKANEEILETLRGRAGAVSHLRVLDVLAWKAGRNAA